MLKKISFILLIIITLSSCQSKKSNKIKDPMPFDITLINKNLSTIDITNTNNSQKITIPSELQGTIDLSKLIDSIWYVPLETNKNSLIGKVDKVILHNNLIYISDLSLSKSIFIFSEKGKFINKISNNGKGPGEYIKPEFFNLDVDNNTLEITDNYLHKVFIYDLKGSFIRTIPLPFRLNKYCKLPTGELLIDANNRLNEQWQKIQSYRIFISDSMFNLKGVGLTYDYSKSIETAYKSPNIFFYDNKNPLFVEPFNDSIFQISSNKLSVKYLLDFENFKKPEPLANFESLKIFFKEYANNDNYAIFLGDFLKTQNIILINLLYKGRTAYVFYNTKNKDIVGGMNMDIKKIKNALFFVPPISTTKNAFISVLQSYDVINISEEWKKNDDILKYRNKSIIEFASSIKPGDNPILMFTDLD